MPEVCCVFFEAGACTLEDAAAALVDQGLTIQWESGHLVAGRPGAPQFRVTLSQALHVQREAAAIAAGTPHESAIGRFSARFEIAIDDLEEALEEINTLMEVQGALQDASRGYLFLPWNGSLTRPWQAG